MDSERILQIHMAARKDVQVEVVSHSDDSVPSVAQHGTLSKLPAQKQSQRSGNGSPWRKKDMNQPSSSTRWFRGLWDGHSETDDNSEAHAPSQKTNSKSADPESSVHVIWKESLYCTTSPLVPNTRLYTWLARGNSQEQTENEQTDVPHCASCEIYLSRVTGKPPSSLSMELSKHMD
ncbi:uncharacterized protein LOC113593790 isoform X3 [Acinonyx jubatus]|uniref:Uncharacterized protein LOC113593790 isoform X3 n=1 Tax=Acinonyx jubatus TaxID=32536 RepID=A0ABM3NJY5_ACIJB|nr:uncharacterized protein LOC113593790 isoform X3 [Acinonyx jubatus]